MDNLTVETLIEAKRKIEDILPVLAVKIECGVEVYDSLKRYFDDNNGWKWDSTGAYPTQFHGIPLQRDESLDAWEYKLYNKAGVVIKKGYINYETRKV